MLCECGCTKMVKIWKDGGIARFVKGHNRRGIQQTEEWKQRNSARMMGNQHLLGYVPTEGARKATSERMIGKQIALGMRHTDGWKQNKSEHQKRLWADPVYHRKQQSKMASGSRLQRPNKLEIKSRDLLDHLYPSEWPYTGDSSVIVGGKNPDFVNEKRKLIIEVLGGWWHRGQNPQDRIDFFQQYGYRTLIIWEHELKNVSRLIGRIKDFVERRDR